MGILFPIALGLLALAIPIILLYLLRLRREPLVVSSTVLWRRVLEDKAANAPWQRLRRNWLLLLQLLLLALLVLALCRPFLSLPTQVSGNLIVLLDGSATMQATDVQPTRFEAAKRKVNTLIDGLNGGQPMTLILMRGYPEVLATASTDKNVLHAALDRAHVTSEPINTQEALTLAAATAQRSPDANVVIVSDGAFSRADKLPDLRARITYMPVGANDQNTAIAALSVREAGANPQIFVAIANYGSTPATPTIVTTVDGKILDTRDLNVPANSTINFTLENAPATTLQVNATLTGKTGQDFLPADNSAWTIRKQGAPRRVLMVTDGNGYINKFFNQVRGYSLTVTTPAEYSAITDNYDLYIFDSYLPPQLPRGMLLLFNPPDSEWIPAGGTLDAPTFARIVQSDPLLQYVDPSGFYVARAKKLVTPGWMRVVAATANNDPLILAGEQNGQRVVALAYSLQDSEMPLTIYFPIFMINTLRWLEPQGSLTQVTQVRPGETLTLPVTADVTKVVVTQPDGTQTQVVPTNGTLSYTETGRVGIYGLERFVGNKSARENFVVNLFDPTASTIAPVAQNDLKLATDVATGNAADARATYEFWLPIVAVALLLLMVEWWLSYRGERGLARLWRRAPKRTT